ncbi:MAG: hypothetical protein U0804_16670 [Gemmataceae bacterium]
MKDHKDQVHRGWAKFLNPESLRGNLIAASIYLAAFEVLQSSVIDRIRGFFSNDFKDGKPLESEDYRSHCLALAKSPFRASLLWLKKMSAISDDDIALVDRIREHRNAIAHNLPEFLGTADTEVNVQLLANIHELVAKIDRWWIQEVDMTISPEYDGREIPADQISSGNMLFIQMMLQIATGEESGELWEQFQKHFG